MFPDLRSFLDCLRADGDLATVDAPVDAYLEAAEIHRRVIAAGGPALVFTNVRVGTPSTPPAPSRLTASSGLPASPFRLATNLFGTAKRAERAFGDRPHRLVRR